MKKYQVYMIHSPDSEWRYIGITSQLLSRRLQNHEVSRTRVGNFIRSHKNATASVLCDNLTRDEAVAIETWLVPDDRQKRDRLMLLNLTGGGGLPPSDNWSKYPDTTKMRIATTVGNANKNRLSDPKERHKVRERTTDYWKNMTDAEREEIGNRISAGHRSKPDPRKFSVKNADGIVIDDTAMKFRDFCVKYNIGQSSLSGLMQGKFNCLKGWVRSDYDGPIFTRPSRWRQENTGRCRA